MFKKKYYQFNLYLPRDLTQRKKKKNTRGRTKNIMQDFFFFFWSDSREICESVICYCEALNDWPVIIKRSIRANCLQTRHSVHGLLNSFAPPPPPPFPTLFLAVLLQLIFRNRRATVYSKFYTLVLPREARIFRGQNFSISTGDDRASLPIRMETNSPPPLAYFSPPSYLEIVYSLKKKKKKKKKE